MNISKPFCSKTEMWLSTQVAARRSGQDLKVHGNLSAFPQAMRVNRRVSLIIRVSRLRRTPIQTLSRSLLSPFLKALNAS